MSTTAAALRAAASRADLDAASARDTALDLERYHALLEHRLTPVLDRHTDEVWQSRAASASRLRLRITAVGDLQRARRAIVEIVEQVRRRALVLESRAADHRREANRLDALAALAPTEPASLVESVTATGPWR